MRAATVERDHFASAVTGDRHDFRVSASGLGKFDCRVLTQAMKRHPFKVRLLANAPDASGNSIVGEGLTVFGCEDRKAIR